MVEKSPQSSKSSAMWGGRFEAGPSAVMEAINASVDVDRRMAEQDIDGSLAHAQMLSETGVISSEDAAAIRQGLEQIREEIRAGDFTWSAALEDVHMNVEARLKAIIGEPAGRLHTARSRNDQSRPTSVSGCATPATGSMPSWPNTRRRWSPRPKSMSTR